MPISKYKHAQMSVYLALAYSWVLPVLGFCKQAEVGVPVAEVIRKAGISEQTFYRSQAKLISLGLGTRNCKN
jgi:hypothetical protein